MTRIKILALFLVLAHSFYAQTTVYRDTIPVYESNTKLLMPWAGGINFSSFTSIDLNADGKNDIVGYDKIGGSGGRLRAYLNVGSPGVSRYLHSYTYQQQFPAVNDWALFFDYNNDGKADLFTYTTGGIKVFRNTSVGSALSFALASHSLTSDYNPTGTPNVSNLYCNSVALPGIGDIDQDGDLDVLSYSVFGTRIEYHKNMSMELYGHADSLVFDMVDDCWGDINENNCQVDLNVCPFMKKYQALTTDSVRKVLHSGSCIMCLDRDGDGDQELVMGDISCSNVFFVENEGSSTNAHIGDTTIMFPNYPVRSSTNVIRLNSFPCTFHLDVDNDGQKDLIASPNAISGAENYQSVWYYKNASSTATVNFVFQKKNFLQEDMMEFGEGAYPVLFDANGDGKKDLIVGNLGYYTVNTNKSKLAYYKNIGSAASPSFSLVTRDYQSLSSYNIFSMAPTFGDLDNDGDQDLIIGDMNGELHYFENTAGFGNAAVFSNHVGKYQNIDVGTFAYPQLFDVDNNGTLDLVVGSQNGKLDFRKNIGTPSAPSFTTQTAFFGGVDVRQSGWSTGFSIPYMYRDAGVTRLLVGSEMGNIYLYNNIDGNLTGSFNRVDTTLFHINEGPRCAPFYEDITNDGKRDLFLGNYAGGLAFFNSTNVNGVGIEELFKEENIAVYPNPASDKITIAIKDNTYAEIQIRCYDVLGKVVYETTTFNKISQIDVSAFSKGIYFIQLQSKDDRSMRSVTKKVVVQ
ncbi:MAG: T9SS type A sorting domain-containing protein [Bacteroidetes bacterium]|nr:T9SS type A sorting domain-containing protein [Bacteroidota bacterium]